MRKLGMIFGLFAVLGAAPKAAAEGYSPAVAGIDSTMVGADLPPEEVIRKYVLDDAKVQQNCLHSRRATITNVTITTSRGRQEMPLCLAYYQYVNDTAKSLLEKRKECQQKMASAKAGACDTNSTVECLKRLKETNQVAARCLKEQADLTASAGSAQMILRDKTYQVENRYRHDFVRIKDYVSRTRRATP